MGFEWDEEKDRQNLTKHGIGFRTAIEIFDDPARTVERSEKQGEERWLTTGFVLGKLWTLVYAKRGDAIRIISVRRTRRNEKEGYHRSILNRGDQADES